MDDQTNKNRFLSGLATAVVIGGVTLGIEGLGEQQVLACGSVCNYFTGSGCESELYCKVCEWNCFYCSSICGLGN